MDAEYQVWAEELTEEERDSYLTDVTTFEVAMAISFAAPFDSQRQKITGLYQELLWRAYAIGPHIREIVTLQQDLPPALNAEDQKLFLEMKALAKEGFQNAAGAHLRRQGE